MAPRPELNPLHVIRERHREHDGVALHIVSYMYMTGYYTGSRVSVTIHSITTHHACCTIIFEPMLTREFRAQVPEPVG